MRYLCIAVGAGCLGAFVSVLSGRNLPAALLLLLGVLLLIIGFGMPR